MAEINVYDSLDERCAARHFLGKSLEEAEALFRENPRYYFEDLMWMGPVAFRYYVTAAIRSLHNPQRWDSCAARCFISVVDFRLDYEPSELKPDVRVLIAVVDYIFEHVVEFRLDASVREQLAVLRTRLREL